jgi:hypothetical protein
MKTTLVSTFALLAVAVTLGGGESRAWAQAGESWVQDNGISCRPEPTQFADFTRSLSGLRNISNGTRRAYCPIATPMFDSDDFAPLRVRQGRIYYTTFTSPPSCLIYSMTRTGSANWSNPGTPDFWSGWNISFPVFDPPQGTISIGYICDMPAGSSLHGSNTRFAITRVHGGV